MTLPANFPELCRDAGLEVVEIPNWENRRRPGAHNPGGTLWHHVGSSGNGRATADWMALRGRPDLPAPLCQLSLDRQGVVYVSAAGRANHAGKAKSSGPMASGDGNAIYVGVECHNTGTEGWGKPQYEAMVTLAVVLTRLRGGTAESNRMHRETSITGKWDPGGLDERRFREDIAHQLKGERAPKMTHVQQSRIKLGLAISALHESLVLLDEAPLGKRREVIAARTQRAGMQAARRALSAIYKRYPEK